MQELNRRNTETVEYALKDMYCKIQEQQIRIDGLNKAWVIISDVTDGSGNISASYTYASSQPFSGRVRAAPVSGTVDSSSGLTMTILTIPDS